MTREKSLRQLMIIWGVGAMVLGGLMLALSMVGKYGSETRTAFGWLVGAIAPTLSLVTTAALSDSTDRWHKGRANLFRGRLARGASFAYLAALLLMLVAEPLVSLNSFEIFEIGEIPIALAQAVAAAAITAVIFDGR